MAGEPDVQNVCKGGRTMNRKLVFSVDMRHCKMEVFRCGGKGGQKQNKTSSGVRIRHLSSGAVGESREERSQTQNKRQAFVRMAQSRKFQKWAREQALCLPDIDALVDEAMQEHNLLVEVGHGASR
jgi:protein subunit release factor B